METTVTALRTAAGSRELVPLLRDVAAGNRRALSDLYRKTSAKLYGICLRLLPSEAEAQEVLQEVYVTIWANARLYDDNKASPITWLGVLARNKAIDRLRLRRIDTEELDAASEMADDRPLAFAVIEQQQERQRLFDCLDELEERQQGVIRAAFLDGATYPELAERESVPLGTMKSWISRGLLRLRGCMDQ